MCKALHLWAECAGFSQLYDRSLFHSFPVHQVAKKRGAGRGKGRGQEGERRLGMEAGKVTLEEQSAPRGKKINQRFPSSHYRLAFTASEPLS